VDVNRRRIPLWPDVGSAEGHSREQEMLFDGNRMVRNVVIPTLEVFRPDGDPSGTAVIVAPGGAHHFLMIDYEGTDLARWLVVRGVTAFVLRYRVRRTPEDDALLMTFHQALVEDLQSSVGRMDFLSRFDDEARAAARLGEDDGQQAVRLVRRGAAEWGLSPRRIGIAGFSAGGSIALSAALSHEDACRPDFVAAIYPGTPKVLNVPADAPPLFITAARDDDLVPAGSAVAIWKAWHEAGRDAELHVFRSGGHGFGMKRTDSVADAWIDLYDHWLHSLGLT
jgi:acetyl esterase/lipase